MIDLATEALAGLPPLPAAVVSDLGFLHEVSAATAGVSRLEMCIQCGTCGGCCPSAADMEHTPRQLFAMILDGEERELTGCPVEIAIELNWPPKVRTPRWA